MWERNNVAVDADPNTAGDQPETTGYEYDLVGNLDLQRNANGTVADYEYDSLNRLDTLTHTTADGTVLALFDYTVRADGKRIAADEFFDLNGDGTLDPVTERNHVTWDYGAHGRLIEEVFDHYDDLYDQLLGYEYDLAGNRTVKTLDKGLDGTIDETTVYQHDANDRLREEHVNGSEKSTIYDYGDNNEGTQQTLKRVWQNGVLTSRTENAYDLQGRMKSVTVETYDAAGVNIIRRETTSYIYDASGIRVSSTQETDADGDGAGGSTVTTTTYLSDPHNPTGYAQTLEEVTKNETGTVTKRIVYTIGHDQISQTVYDAANPSGATHTFHADGHGSTRVLTDAVAAIVQHYAYDAHGNALGLDPAVQRSSPTRTLITAGTEIGVRPEGQCSVGLLYVRCGTGVPDARVSRLRERRKNDNRRWHWR